MTKYRVTTENGDTLFYGIKTALQAPYAGWAFLEFQGSDAQHDELARHLNRHNSSWVKSFVGADGQAMYALPPYFKIESVNNWESEQDAAVRSSKELPVYGVKDQPKAVLTGADPYSTEINVLFLDLGERFRAERTVRGKKQVRYGTAAIVGFGLREEFHDRYLGLKPLEAYINVHWDDAPEGAYKAAVVRDDRRGIAYEPQGALWPNDTLYPGFDEGGHGGFDKGGWIVYGLPEVAERRYTIIKAYREGKRLADAQKRVADAKAALARAELDLQNLTK